MSLVLIGFYKTIRFSWNSENNLIFTPIFIG